MFSGFISAFRTPDLRKKLLLTLGIIAIYRLGVAIPTPGVDYKAVQACAAGTASNSALDILNLFAGGALLHL